MRLSFFLVIATAALAVAQPVDKYSAEAQQEDALCAACVCGNTNGQPIQPFIRPIPVGASEDEVERINEQNEESLEHVNEANEEAQKKFAEDAEERADDLEDLSPAERGQQLQNNGQLRSNSNPPSTEEGRNQDDGFSFRSAFRTVSNGVKGLAVGSAMQLGDCKKSCTLRQTRDIGKMGKKDYCAAYPASLNRGPVSRRIAVPQQNGQIATQQPQQTNTQQASEASPLNKRQLMDIAGANLDEPLMPVVPVLPNIPA